LEDCDGFHHQIPLARLDTTARGYPYHLISATANYIRRHNRAQGSAGHFLFSRLYCGSSRTGYQHTEAYCGGTYDLASAMAISSAAVSPAQMKNLFIAILLLVLNFRLGQWLPNPGHKPWWPNWLHRHVTRWPSPFLVLASLLRKSEQRGYCFVTDGGHYENLGVGPLLRRNCRLMISSDVGHDPDYQFRDFISLQRQQRMDNGIEIAALDQGILNFDELLPDPGNKVSKTHYVIARVVYPHYCRLGERTDESGAEYGYLIYLKPTFTGKEDLDLATQKRGDPTFPHDSTADQFYPPEKFESYRRLGYHIGKLLCEEYFHDVRLADWEPSVHIAQQRDTALAQASRGGPEAERAPGPESLTEAIAQLQDADPLRREAAAALLDEALDNPGTQAQATHLLTGKLLQKGPAALRQTILQMLKRHADAAPTLLRAAVTISRDASEKKELRLAALDWLASCGPDCQAAIEQLRHDGEPNLAVEAERLLRGNQTLVR
jgi:hypothetical protein